MTMRKRGNKWRARCARLTLAHYANAKGGYEFEHDRERLTDLLTDLMHFAATSKDGASVDFEDALRRAHEHFEAEFPPVPVAPYPSPACRHTSCRFCELDIEGMAPYKRGTWRDRGNNSTCPSGANEGKAHAPYLEKRT